MRRDQVRKGSGPGRTWTLSEPLTNREATSADPDERILSGSVADAVESYDLSDLTAYLSKLGLGDVGLARVMSLLKATHSEPDAQVVDEVVEPEAGPGESLPIGSEQPSPLVQNAGTKSIRLFMAEEQEILMEAYRNLLESQPSVELLGCWSDTGIESLIQTISKLQPNVMLLGVKALRPSTVEKLEALRDAFPSLGMVLLFAFYDAQGIKALREYSRDVSVGRAYLLKHTIDTVAQLTHAITGVAEGRMIVDPTVMEELIKNRDSKSGLLQQLSPKALEVLHLVSRGYRNETIAGVLSRDVKTVERHINNIYTTLLSPEDDPNHPRVRASLMYLQATGVLSNEIPVED